VFFESSEEFAFLFGSLEAAISEFARSVDELEGNLFASSMSRLVEDRFSEGDDSFSGSSGGSFDHQEVFTDHTVVVESAHGVDGFLGHIELSRSTLVVSSLSDSVDLFVDFGSVEVASLTSTGNGVLNSARMPCSNTSDLSQSFVGLARKSGDSPTFDDTFKTVSLGYTNHVDHLVLVEDRGNINRLLKEILGEINFLSGGSSVDLDFHQMSFLLSLLQLSDLGVGQDSDDSAVFLDLSKISIDGLVLVLRKVFQGIFGESLLLGLVPVFVEASSNIVAQVLGPDSLEVSDSERSFDIANNSNGDHGGNFKDGDRLDNFLFM